MGCKRAKSASSLLSLKRGTEVWEQLVAQESGRGNTAQGADRVSLGTAEALP